VDGSVFGDRVVRDTESPADFAPRALDFAAFAFFVFEPFFLAM
jgi:hypothetical protein